MTPALKDLMDLDYLLHLDRLKTSQGQGKIVAARDRDIYRQVDGRVQDEKELILSWLSFRKLLFFHETPDIRLPGTVFVFLYQWMAVILGGCAGLAGFFMVYTFLAYHGTRPVNVALFFALFILVPALLFLLAAWILVQRWIDPGRPGVGVVQPLVTLFFVRGLPWVLKKIQGLIPRQDRETLEYVLALVRMKNREYQGVMFWSFFMLTCLGAFCFSAGTLAATLFRVAVSDIAFGWQSTLVGAGEQVEKIVSLIALPWAWMVSPSVAHPDSGQIEGSRILLKEGIAGLATQDLISWWPFLALGILFYGVLPRLVLILAGVTARRRALARFDFQKPRFQQLLIRMRSPVMDIQSDEGPEPSVPPTRKGQPDPRAGNDPDVTGARALVAAEQGIYSGADLTRIHQFIQKRWQVSIAGTAQVQWDFSRDEPEWHRLVETLSPDLIILVQEARQPPIRGLLHYFIQVRTQVPGSLPVWILLTGSSSSPSLGVGPGDLNIKVWETAVLKLADPGMAVERMDP